MSIEKYRKMLKRAKEHPEYWTRKSALEFAYSLQRLLDEDGLKRKDLAEGAGVAPPSVSTALSGDANLTIKTMNKLAAVVDAAVHIYVERRGIDGQWVRASDPPESAAAVRALTQRPTLTEPATGSAETATPKPVVLSRG
ncbi:MAG: helix-turn-helix domain-containing protein [bacterium]|nr:helix-turn-helix domain-containing protein [bacterium]